MQLKWVKYFNRHFTKVIQTVNMRGEGCSLSLIIQEIKTYFYPKTCMQVFTAALFKIAQKLKTTGMSFTR